MTNERKIWEAAILLVGRHGILATDIAEREASRYYRRQDDVTCAVWCWISRATAEILKDEPESGEQVH
ncbi:MAG: hypothetical protein JWL84_5530 [Rhodospirillales bacterium]|nr:hypothetical protein [Rhodospirillales bacterium]